MLSRTIFTGWLLLGLLVQPFVFHELPRVWFIHRWIEGLVLIGLIVFIKCPKKQVIDTKILAAVIGFFITVVAVSILGIDWQKSLWGNYWRSDGLLTLIHFIALWLILILAWDKLWPEKIIKTIGVSSFLISFWAVIWNFKLLVLHQAVPNWQGVIGVSFNQPVFFAGWLAVTLPTLLFLPKFWKLTGLLLQISAILLTRAWGGYLGILIFSVGWFLIAGKKFKLLNSLSILILLIMAGGLIWKTNNYLESGMWAKTAESRERIVVKGLLGWWQRPMFGWGWANYDRAFQSVDWPIKYNVDVYVDKAHSNLLEVLVTTGIVGLSIYLLILILMAKQLSGYYLLMFWLWLIHSQTNVVSISEDLIFWLLLSFVTISSSKKVI